MIAALPRRADAATLPPYAIACNAVIDGLWLEGSALPEAFEPGELARIALSAVGSILGVDLSHLPRHAMRYATVTDACQDWAVPDGRCISGRAQIKARAPDVIELTIGEPDVPTRRTDRGASRAMKAGADRLFQRTGRTRRRCVPSPPGTARRGGESSGPIR